MKDIKILVFRDINNTIICTFDEKTVMNVTLEDYFNKLGDFTMQSKDEMNLVEHLKFIDYFNEKTLETINGKQLEALYSFKKENYKIKKLLFSETVELKGILRIANYFGLERLKKVINVIEN